MIRNFELFVLVVMNPFSRSLLRIALYAARLPSTTLLIASLSLLVSCAHLSEDSDNERVFEHFRVSDAEITQGGRGSKVMQASFPVVEDTELNARVDAVLLGMMSAAKLSQGEFKVIILKTDMPQAYSLPNGHLFITTGLLKLLDGDDEVAVVLSHEIAHVVMHDALDGQAFVDGAIKTLSHFGAQNEGTKTVAGDFAVTAYFGMRREQELQADKLGFFLLRRANYGCAAFPTVLQKLIVAENSYGFDADTTHIDDDHPATRERLGRSQALIRQYKDECEQAGGGG